MPNQCLFVGIDVSKLKHDIAIVDEHKKLVGNPFVIQENRPGYQQLLGKLHQVQQRYDAPLLAIGLEATGDYWKNLYHFLKQPPHAFPVTVINPFQTKTFATSKLRRAKTDRVDAIDIAQFMAERRPEPSVDRPRLLDHIKDLDAQIYAQKKQQTMAINRLRSELGKVAPEIEQATRVLGTKQMLALLLDFPTAEAIERASMEQVRSVRYGQRQWRLPVGFASRMKGLAEDSIAHKRGPGAGLVVQSLVRRILACQQEVCRLNEQMVALYESVNPNPSLLTTIPGITKQTAIILEAYIGDVGRFANAKKIVAYFGMNPTVNKSGKAINRKSYLEKKGSGRVRQMLYMVCLSIIQRRESPIYPYYDRLVKSGKPKLVALCAAMRKLLVIIYFVLKNQVPFNPNR